MEIQQALFKFIQSQAPEKVPDTLDADYELIDSGIIDSLLMMELVTYLEQQYQFEFGLNDIVPQNFHTINTLSAFVNRQLAGNA